MRISARFIGVLLVGSLYTRTVAAPMRAVRPLTGGLSAPAYGAGAVNALSASWTYSLDAPGLRTTLPLHSVLLPLTGFAASERAVDYRASPWVAALPVSLPRITAAIVPWSLPRTLTQPGQVEFPFSSQQPPRILQGLSHLSKAAMPGDVWDGALARQDAASPGQSVSSEGLASAGRALELQTEFEEFLAQDGRLPLAVPAPKISGVASKLLKNIGKSRLGMNRYSFERNHFLGHHSITTMIAWVAHWGLDFMQIHVSSFKGLSDEEIRGAAAAARQYGIEIQLDVSSTRKKDLNNLFRIADLMETVHPVGMIRTYVRESGRLTDIIATAIRGLQEVLPGADRRGIPLVLEQHELLTVSEMRSILETVGGTLGALFDFANPITAGERPEAVLRGLRGLTRMTHIKDALTLPTEKRGWHHYGVKLGEGDLNVIEMIYEALSQGADLSLQSEVGYSAFAARDDSTGPDSEFARRPPSETYVSEEVMRSPSRLRKTLEDEVLDARQQLDYIRWVRDKLEDFALRSLGRPGLPGISSTPPASQRSPDIRKARRIEAIGRRLFPDDPKAIWHEGSELTPETWEKIQAGNTGMGRGVAGELLGRADRLKRQFSPPLYNRDR